jgi:hypothetical protein
LISLALAGNAGALQGLLFLLDCIQLQEHRHLGFTTIIYSFSICMTLSPMAKAVPNFSTFGGAGEARRGTNLPFKR